MTSSSAKEGSVGSVRKMFTSPTMHSCSSTPLWTHRCLSKMMNVHSGTLQSGFKENEVKAWTVLSALKRRRLTVVVLSPALLHVELLVQRERLWGRQLLQLRTLHPFMIPGRTGQRQDTAPAFYTKMFSVHFLKLQERFKANYVRFLISGTYFILMFVTWWFNPTFNLFSLPLLFISMKSAQY